MNYDQLKLEVSEIVAISKDVPEEFRAKCFEMLLQHLLKAASPPERDKVASVEEKQQEKRSESDSSKDGTKDPKQKLSLPGIVKAFMRRNDVSDDDLSSVIMIEEGEFHFIKEPTHKKLARGQNEWALLISLKNALTGNALVVDPEDVRSMVQDKGFYDQRNFATNFKSGKYASYYKGTMEPQGAAQGLTADGEAALATLVKTLASS